LSRVLDAGIRATARIFASMRPAFTIIELLIAIVVFTIGLLGLAATAGTVAGHVGDSARLTGSAHLARSILDSLGTLRCDAIAAGAESNGRLAAQWTVRRDSLSAQVDLVVGSELRRGRRRDPYALVVPCKRD
jgi:prepilin-type N-terminal cleavage/methylation domain-containing protein